MTLAEKITRAKDDYDAVYAAGKAAGGGGGGDYDAGFAAGYDQGMGEGIEAGRANGIEDGKLEAYHTFWDEYQQGGVRTAYEHAFGGGGWTDNTFKPKYNMQVTAAREMFSRCRITDLKAKLDELGVTIDFSRCTDFTLTFANSEITHIGVLDISSYKKPAYVLNNASKVVTVDKLVLAADGSQVFTATSAFQGASELVNISVEGIIGSSVSFQSSNKLSRASIESIMTALSDATTGQTLTIHKSAVEAAFTTDEWNTLVATKSNWTIAKA